MKDAPKIDWPDIVKRHGPLVWRTALAILGNQADVADCFQETFTAALSVTDESHVRHWPAFLQRIATRRALDMIRQRIRDRMRHDSPEELGMIATTDAGPLQHTEANELAARLRRALGRLPQHQSEVYCLRYLSDLSYEEIAAQLGISTDSVGVTLHRARARLQELLESASEVNHDQT